MTAEHFLKSLDRRTFLRIASLTGIAGLAYPRKAVSSLLSPALSRLAVVRDDTATNGVAINADTVQVMVDNGIRALAQKDSLSDAWMSLIPGLRPSSVVALKINGINPSLPTHPATTYAVAESLKKISFGDETFPENNIIIFDRGEPPLVRSGYALNDSSTGVRCLENRAVGYSRETYDVHNSSQRLSKIVTEMADHLINISVLKNHGTAGATMCLKNHYGTCDRPGAMHGNYADPYIPALNALEPIAAKQCLNICDALLGIRSGGPGGSPQFVANSLLMGQDIIAVDFWATQILEQNDCRTIARASHIATADAQYQLGTSDPSRIDIIGIPNPTQMPYTAVETHEPNPQSPAFFQLQQNYPNPFNSRTQIRYRVPRPLHGEVTVLNSQGQRVRSLVSGVLEAGWHQASWDGRSDAGARVASGVYLCQLGGEGFQQTIIMQLLK